MLTVSGFLTCAGQNYLAFHLWLWLLCGFSRVLFNSLMSVWCLSQENGRLWQRERCVHMWWWHQLSPGLSTSVMAWNESSCLQLSSYLHSYELYFTVSTVVFPLLQGKSYLKSTVQVQEGVFSMERSLLKMEILTVVHRVPLLRANFPCNAEDLWMVSTVVTSKV